MSVVLKCHGGSNFKEKMSKKDPKGEVMKERSINTDTGLPCFIIIIYIVILLFPLTFQDKTLPHCHMVFILTTLKKIEVSLIDNLT